MFQANPCALFCDHNNRAADGELSILKADSGPAQGPLLKHSVGMKS
jgi:hypothetical protein